jgi:hypothetical protein
VATLRLPVHLVNTRYSWLPRATVVFDLARSLRGLVSTMDPPFRVSAMPPEPPTPVETVRRRLSASTGSALPSMVAGREHSADVGSTRSSLRNLHDSSKEDILGQFSFAPATQTTVVTTTTTTTTNFPPLMMKAPHHLHEMDPKLYPLASSPTPKSIKRFCFDVEGKPTYFNEAEDALDALRGVSHILQYDVYSRDNSTNCHALL